MMVVAEGITTEGGNRYALAGWLAIAQAVLLFPEIGVAVVADYLLGTSPFIKVAVAPIHIASMLVGIYVLYMFRDLLGRRFEFHRTDNVLVTLIGANVVFIVLGILGLVLGLLAGAAEDLFDVLTLVLFVPYNIIVVVFGIMLLKLEDDLFGLLKPLVFMTITSGVLGATIILSPLGLLAHIASLIILGMVFLRAKGEIEFL
jgi:hypothetical protein